MKRKISTHLRTWAQVQEHQPLLIRGARQVGKTFSVRELGRDFVSFVEINFERDIEVHPFFEGSIDPAGICRKLSIYSGKPIVPGQTLLFLDEIQALPPALHALRFFYEEMPALHVAAAGSLLEFAFAQIPSMGVGRLSSLFMYPLSFEEFLWALDEERLAEEIGGSSANKPLDPVFHRRSLDLMRTHMMVGGLPAVVECYRSTRDVPACQKRLEDILLILYDDFAKYESRVPESKLLETFNSVVRQSGGKFILTRAAQGSPIGQYKQAIHLLTKAHIVRQIHHTSANGIPLAAEVDEKKFKAFVFDVGIHLRALGLDLSGLIVQDTKNLVCEGSLAEVYAGIELTAGMPPHLRPDLYYWHRENRGSNAEIDYVAAKNGTIIPIEVKAGTRGAMQSLHLFLGEKRAPHGIRLSHENFGAVDRIDIFPLYAAGWLLR